MSGHTKGPWRSLYEELFCVAAGEKLVARLPHSISDEQEANARLIAAAPDLLEAAQQTRTLLEEMTDEDGPGYSVEQAEQVLRDVRAAIEKAEGRNHTSS